MTNVKNKTEILKVILLVYTIFACLIFFVGETNCSPQSAMNAELQRNYEIQNVINLIGFGLLMLLMIYITIKDIIFFF